MMNESAGTLAKARRTTFQAKRGNWESKLTQFTTEAAGIGDTPDAIPKLNTLLQKIQNAVDGLDVGGYQVKPLVQSLTAKAGRLGLRLESNEADDALVQAAESVDLSELKASIATAKAAGKPGLANRLQAVYDRRKKADDDAKKIKDEADQKAKDDAAALKKLQDESDAKLKTIEEEAAATKKNLIIGGVVALGVILLLVSRK